MSKKPGLTMTNGCPVADNQNVLTAGARGPMLLQDVWFLEKLAHFDREVIPELRMHAKGSGAYGTFTVTNDISQYSKAKLFSEVGKQTDVFLRFSTVAGERGAAEDDGLLARRPRDQRLGFAGQDRTGGGIQSGDLGASTLLARGVACDELVAPIGTVSERDLSGPRRLADLRNTEGVQPGREPSGVAEDDKGLAAAGLAVTRDGPRGDLRSDARGVPRRDGEHGHEGARIL